MINKTFVCQLEIKDRDALILELKHIIQSLEMGYTSGLNWNTDLNSK